jgi:hypothetical protein
MKHLSLLALLFVGAAPPMTHWRFHVDTLANIEVLKCDGEFAEVWADGGKVGLPNPIPNNGSWFDFYTREQQITVANDQVPESTLIMSNCDQPVKRF